MDLRETCRKIIFDLLRSVKVKDKWKVLVVDDLAFGILTSCFTVFEILRESIAVIEEIEKVRKPLSSCEAIYLITPTFKTIDILINDFHEAGCLYRNAHLFFLSSVSDNLFECLCNSTCANYIQTFKEINISFLPFESQVFTLQDPNCMKMIYPSHEMMNSDYFTSVAENIVSVCCTMGLMPLIRYSRSRVCNMVLAEKVHSILEVSAEKFPDMFKNDIPKSYLLILDRGIDCISPVLHELTLQAMVYDLLPIENNEYRVSQPEAENGEQSRRAIALDESDTFWVENRHRHIAHVSDTLQNVMKKHSLVEDNGVGAKSRNELRRISRDMGNIILLNLRRRYYDYQHMISSCLEFFTSNIKKLCLIEQDLALKSTPEGLALQNTSEVITNVIRDENIASMDKLRMIILFILYHDVFHTFKRNCAKEESTEKCCFQGITLDSSFEGYNRAPD